jgi:hypothetical protein
VCQAMLFLDNPHAASWQGIAITEEPHPWCSDTDAAAAQHFIAAYETDYGRQLPTFDSAFRRIQVTIYDDRGSSSLEHAVVWKEALAPIIPDQSEWTKDDAKNRQQRWRLRAQQRHMEALRTGALRWLQGALQEAENHHKRAMVRGCSALMGVAQFMCGLDQFEMSNLEKVGPFLNQQKVACTHPYLTDEVRQNLYVLRSGEELRSLQDYSRHRLCDLIDGVENMHTERMTLPKPEPGKPKSSVTPTESMVSWGQVYELQHPLGSTALPKQTEFIPWDTGAKQPENFLAAVTQIASIALKNAVVGEVESVVKQAFGDTAGGHVLITSAVKPFATCVEQIHVRAKAKEKEHADKFKDLITVRAREKRLKERQARGRPEADPAGPSKPVTKQVFVISSAFQKKQKAARSPQKPRTAPPPAEDPEKVYPRDYWKGKAQDELCDVLSVQLVFRTAGELITVFQALIDRGVPASNIPDDPHVAPVERVELVMLSVDNGSEKGFDHKEWWKFDFRKIRCRFSYYLAKTWSTLADDPEVFAQWEAALRKVGDTSLLLKAISYMQSKNVVSSKAKICFEITFSVKEYLALEQGVTTWRKVAMARNGHAICRNNFDSLGGATSLLEASHSFVAHVHGSGPVSVSGPE